MAVMKFGNLDPVPAPFAYLVDTEILTPELTFKRFKLAKVRRKS
jgi:hypothetical protein